MLLGASLSKTRGEGGPLETAPDSDPSLHREAGVGARGCASRQGLLQPPACFSGLVWFGFAKHCCFRFLYNSRACVQKGQFQVKPGSFIFFFFSNLVCRQALFCGDKANLGILRKMLENIRMKYWILSFYVSITNIF